MFLSLATALLFASPQGVDVVVLQPTGDATHAALIANTLRTELTAQGYAALETKKGAAEVATTIERSDKKWLVKVLLRKTADGSVLTELREEAEGEALEKVSRNFARVLASQLRQTFGIRVRVSVPKPK